MLDPEVPVIDTAVFVKGNEIPDVAAVTLNPDISLKTKRKFVATGRKKSSSMSCTPEEVSRITFDSSIAPALFCNSTNNSPVAFALMLTLFSFAVAVVEKIIYLFFAFVFVVAVPEGAVGPRFANVVWFSIK